MLTGPEILRQIALGNIKIDPFDPQWVGPNGVDLHMADELWTYDYALRTNLDLKRQSTGVARHAIDSRKPPALVRQQKLDIVREYHIADDDTYGHRRSKEDREAYLLEPNRLYIGRTAETIELHGFAAQVLCRSSCGRLGVSSTVDAGLIDDGFIGTITTEMLSGERVLLYPYPHRLSRLFQIIFIPVVGERKPYSGRYQGQTGARPSLLAKD